MVLRPTQEILGDHLSEKLDQPVLASAGNLYRQLLKLQAIQPLGKCDSPIGDRIDPPGQFLGERRRRSGPPGKVPSRTGLPAVGNTFWIGHWRTPGCPETQRPNQDGYTAAWRLGICAQPDGMIFCEGGSRPNGPPQRDEEGMPGRGPSSGMGRDQTSARVGVQERQTHLPSEGTRVCPRMPVIDEDVATAIG